MKLIKKLALAAALSSFALAASAMEQIQDTDLSQVSGQDGVSIAANLNVNIGSFVYSTGTGTNAGSVGFNNIGVTGTIAATLDIMSATNFGTAGTGEAFTVLGLTGVTGNATQLASGTGTNLAGSAASAATIAAFYPGTDVVRIAIPDIAATALNVKVGSITMGTNGVQNVLNPSFGSIALNNIQMQGTTAYIWAH